MCSCSVHTFHTSSRGASKTRVPRISRSPTSAAFLLSAAMLRLLGDTGSEALEGQPDPRLVPLGGQLEGHQRVARVALVPPRVREPLVRNRFRDLAAVGIPEAFVFDVELELDTDYRSECTEVEIPLLDVLLVGEGLPHQRHRGVESALDDKRLVLRRQIAFCGHLSSPCVNVLHLVLALQLLQIAFQPVEALFPMAPAQTFFY